MSLSSYCRNCGRPVKTTEELSANHCADCETNRQEAMKHFVEQNKDASESDKLYAGRQALMQRARHPHETFINPRDFNRADMTR